MNTTSAKVAITWAKSPIKGAIEVFHGKLDEPSNGQFTLNADGPARLEIAIKEAKVHEGAFATRVTIRTSDSSFTFLLRDVVNTDNGPLLISIYGVAVSLTDDKRSYAQIADDVASKKTVSDWQRMENLPEETYEEACDRGRDMKCPTWLGLSRDLRIFRVDTDYGGGYWGYVQPMFHSKFVPVPGQEEHAMYLGFNIGRGCANRINITRRLDQGVLPIVRSTQLEEDISYDVTAFASLENGPVTKKNLRGSDWQAAYANVGGNRLKEEDLTSIAELLKKETYDREEELICCVRVVASNTSKTPQYAWFRAAQPVVPGGTMHPWLAKGETFAGGKSILADSQVCSINRINGEPMSECEMAVLIAPGKNAIFETIIPHTVISNERADKIMQTDINEHLKGARKYWLDKLAAGAKISVPEKAIDERIRACLLNCDVNTLGLSKEGPLLATVGNYGPIGSESSPMIQFFDSIGWSDVAERSLEFFLAMQRDDGFIQTYTEYELETGPVLWSMGEHFRFTRDEKWLARVTPNIIKACDYILAWREKNLREELRGKGYGMIHGRVADPEDYYHAFMLNGLTWIGLARAVEMLAVTNPAESKRFKIVLDEYKKNIRESLFESIARGPVIPLGDGSWIPTVASWPGYPGAHALYAEGEKTWTHGVFGARDSLCGALYLLISDVVDCNELAGEIIMKFHQSLFTVENSALSQPYYARHDFGHMKRDEVKLFLKTYYNQFASLEDRETYTFWEHFFHASQNKTHETGWFLMQTRWMLYMEEEQTLKLMRAIPRKWMENGKKIAVENAVSYFGKISFTAESKLDEGKIIADVKCDDNRKPNCVSIRLPHPQNLKPKACVGGTYDAELETVIVDSFSGSGHVELVF